MTDLPRRPWWRKKRWIAAGLLWLLVIYPASEGPVRYAVARGWVPAGTSYAAYRPLSFILIRTPRLFRAFEWRGAYVSWWNGLGNRHRTKTTSIYGPNWKVAIASDLDVRGSVMRTVGTTATYTTHWGGHALAVENGRKTPDGGMAWDGPVTLDGRRAAALPAGTRRLSFEYFDGELTIEADGEPVEVEE